MPSLSPRLELPYLEPSQAQKHVTHNEALRRLDMLVQLSVQGFDENTPPALPVTGHIYALGAAPTDAWAGQAEMLALREDNGWSFVAPDPGWMATLAGDPSPRIWTGAAWAPITGATQNLDGLGVNTSSDATNRLAVAAGATLLSHDGADHRLVINKASATDTGSVLFQSNWTGHAEMGLAGDTGFSVKVSPDGSTWTQALEIDPVTGSVSALSGLEVAGAPAYHSGNLLGGVTQSGGLPTGAVIERGSNSNGDYCRLADGSQTCWHEFTADLAISTSFMGGYRSSDMTWTFPASFIGVPAMAGMPVSGTAFGVSSRTYSSGLVGTFAATAVTSQSTGTIRIRVIATGRWY